MPSTPHLQALTGPVSRGDVGTVVQHLSCLRTHSRETTDIYCLLGRVAVGMAENQSPPITTDQARALREAFGEGLDPEK